MEVKDLCWIICFSIIIFSSLKIFDIFIKYIEHKSPGQQSMYDMVILDLAQVSQVAVSVMCSLAITAQFEIMSSLYQQYYIIGIIPCILFDFVYARIILYFGSVCLTRIFCVLNLELIEDLGEKIVRRNIKLFCNIGGVLMATIDVSSGDIATGLPYSIMTRMNVPTGNMGVFFSPNITN